MDELLPGMHNALGLVPSNTGGEREEETEDERETKSERQMTGVSGGG